MIRGIKRYLLKGVSWGCMLLFSFSAMAQISLKAKIDSTDILIGDLVKLSLEIKHNPEIRILGSELVDSVKAFELLYLSELDSSFQKGLISKKQDFTFISFEPGIQNIPSFRLFYQEQNDTTIKWIATDTFQVNVQLVDVDTSQAIQPIQAPLGVPLKWKDLKPLIYIIPGILLILFIFIYLERKKRNKPLFSLREKPKLPAHLIALNALRKLEEAKLWQKGNVKEFHIQLTDIIRIYIEDRFHLPAVESTTEEIMEDLNSIDLSREMKEELHSFLQLSDLVKFAKHNPLPNENEKCLQSSYHFVNATKEQLFEEENK